MSVALPWTDQPAGRAVAVAGFGPVRRALLVALLRRTDPALALLEGVENDDLVVITGPDLPWAEGALWLTRRPHAPALLLPTRRSPDLPADLLQAAVLRGLPAGSAPVLLLEAPALRVPLGPARPLDRTFLQRALRAETL